MMVTGETAGPETTWVAQATAHETEWKGTTTKEKIMIETTTGAQVIGTITIDRIGPPGG